MKKIDKNTHPPKGTRSGKQLFFPYPSVFAKSYVRYAIIYFLVRADNPALDIQNQFLEYLRTYADYIHVSMFLGK